MDDISQLLAAVRRPRLLWLLAQLIHELTIQARFCYGQADAAARMRETNEAIHRVSGHVRDLTDNDEAFTASGTDSIGEALQLLPPAAIDRLRRFAT